MAPLPPTSTSGEPTGTGDPGVDGTWVERVVDRSAQVQRTRTKSIEQARLIVDAAIRLIPKQGASFTTQELTQEAGVAVQTFYRSFESKDSLLLAVFEELIGEFSLQYAELVADNDDPVDRIRYSVTAAIGSWRSNPEVAQFMTAQHWRLFQLYPKEVAAATSQFSRLIQQDLEEAAAKGLLVPRNPAYDSWLITQLVMAIFHNGAFAQPAEDPEEEAERLWSFCWAALGGTTS
jgi:AcrR family transcriptional regulator